MYVWIELPVEEAESIADALEAAASLSVDDPVEESPLDLVYRCRFCREHDGHLASCPWKRTEVALARLNTMGRA